MDVFVSGLFGVIVHFLTNMNTSRKEFAGTLALLGCASSTLGLAVGALSPTADIALSLGPALMVVYLIVGAIGPGGSRLKLPQVMEAIRLASPMKWACEGLLLAEFKNKPFGPPIQQSKVPSDKSLSKPYGVSSNSRVLAKLLELPKHFIKKLFAPSSSSSSSSSSSTSFLVKKDGDHVLQQLGVDSSKSFSSSKNALKVMLICHLAACYVGLLKPGRKN